jgi:hypothetical protein
VTPVWPKVLHALIYINLSFFLSYLLTLVNHELFFVQKLYSKINKTRHSGMTTIRR